MLTFTSKHTTQMNIQEYTDKHYSKSEQIKAAWAVAANIKRAMKRAERQAVKAKTKEARERNAFNAKCYEHNWILQVRRANSLS